MSFVTLDGENNQTAHRNTCAHTSRPSCFVEMSRSTTLLLLKSAVSHRRYSPRVPSINALDILYVSSG